MDKLAAGAYNTHPAPVRVLLSQAQKFPAFGRFFDWSQLTMLLLGSI